MPGKTLLLFGGDTGRWDFVLMLSSCGFLVLGGMLADLTKGEGP